MNMTVWKIVYPKCCMYRISTCIYLYKGNHTISLHDAWTYRGLLWVCLPLLSPSSSPNSRQLGDPTGSLPASFPHLPHHPKGGWHPPAVSISVISLRSFQAVGRVGWKFVEENIHILSTHTHTFNTPHEWRQLLNRMIRFMTAVNLRFWDNPSEFPLKFTYLWYFTNLTQISIATIEVDCRNQEDNSRVSNLMRPETIHQFTPTFDLFCNWRFERRSNKLRDTEMMLSGGQILASFEFCL